MLMTSSESCIFNDNESIPAIDRLFFYPDKKDEIYHLYSSSLKELVKLQCLVAKYCKIRKVVHFPARNTKLNTLNIGCEIL